MWVLLKHVPPHFGERHLLSQIKHNYCALSREQAYFIGPEGIHHNPIEIRMIQLCRGKAESSVTVALVNVVEVCIVLLLELLLTRAPKER